MADIGYTLTLPSTSPIDNNGDTMPGALLFTYLAGTSTKVDSYTDAALTTPHANPVVADANGRFPAIFLDHTVIYKITIKDPDFVNLSGYPVDNYRMSNQQARPAAYALHYSDLGGFAGTASNGVPYFVNDHYDTIDGVVATVTNDSTDGLTITATEKICLTISFSARVATNNATNYLNGSILLNYSGVSYPSTDAYRLVDSRSVVGNAEDASIAVTASVVLEIGDSIKPQIRSSNVVSSYDTIIVNASATVVS